MSCGLVLPTISTTSCAPLAFSSAASLASSWSTCCALSVPVRSVTCRASFGTAASACSRAGSSKATASSSAHSVRGRRGVISMRRGGGRRRGTAEIDLGCGGDRLLVLHAEIRLHGVAEHLGCEVVREGADQPVVLLHRLHVALARHGDAVLGAFQLRLQVLEQAVGLEVGIVL